MNIGVKAGKMISKNIVPYILMFLICAGAFFTVLPLIDRYIEDPELVTYFNHDEGFIMSLAWYSYSGEKCTSFQFEGDYGIGILYLTMLAKLFSGLMTFTPGIFVLIMRWINLIFWIASLAVLWNLVRRHFGMYWLGLIAVVLLAVNHAFVHIARTSKPEAIVLFFMILGLDFTLRVIDKPKRKYVYIAVACAVSATIIKFAGIFLLPAIIVAVYLANSLQKNSKPIFREYKFAWVFPGVVGLGFSLLSVMPIFWYVRQTTGVTWYEEYGLMHSILKNKQILYFMLSGFLLAGLSFVLGVFFKVCGGRFKNGLKTINKILSIFTVVIMLFFFFSIIFGIGWVTNTGHLMTTYSVTGSQLFLGLEDSINRSGVFASFFRNFFVKIKNFGVIIFSLFLGYIVIEVYLAKRNMSGPREQFLKRVVLCSFAIVAFPCMFFMMRFNRHHMLPFFAACSILSIQGAIMLYRFLKDKKVLRNVAAGLGGALFLSSIVLSASATAKTFDLISNWRQNGVFEIIKWWHKTYPYDTRIVVEHPVYAYLPPEYKNAKILKYHIDRESQLREVVNTFKPQVICYNTLLMPTIEKILPGVKTRLVAVFDNYSYYFHSDPGEIKYVVYEIL